MIALIFIIVVTGLSILISISLSKDVTWIVYYRGGIIGFSLSAVVLYFWNKRRRKKEMEKERRR